MTPTNLFESMVPFLRYTSPCFTMTPHSPSFSDVMLWPLRSRVRAAYLPVSVFVIVSGPLTSSSKVILGFFTGPFAAASASSMEPNCLPFIDATLLKVLALSVLMIAVPFFWILQSLKVFWSNTMDVPSAL